MTTLFEYLSELLKDTEMYFGKVQDWSMWTVIEYYEGTYQQSDTSAIIVMYTDP